MIVVAASRIELCVTGWASVGAGEVLRNGQFRSASPAQDRRLVPFAAWPYFDCVAGQCVVAVLAGVVGAATLHLDRDDIYRLVVVSTTSLWIEIDSAHRWPKI